MIETHNSVSAASGHPLSTSYNRSHYARWLVACWAVLMPAVLHRHNLVCWHATPSPSPSGWTFRPLKRRLSPE